MSDALTERRRPVAYKNDAFLGSPDARILRILSEYLEPLGHFRHEHIRDTIVFFGSARVREDDRWRSTTAMRARSRAS